MHSSMYIIFCISLNIIVINSPFTMFRSHKKMNSGVGMFIGTLANTRYILILHYLIINYEEDIMNNSFLRIPMNST